MKFLKCGIKNCFGYSEKKANNCKVCVNIDFARGVCLFYKRKDKVDLDATERIIKWYESIKKE